MKTRTSFRRTIPVAAIASMLALAGCAGGSAGGSADTLNLWVPPLVASGTADLDVWDDLLEPFEQEHGVQIKVTVVPWAGFPEKMLAGVSSGDGPDVAYMYNKMIGDYIANDQLVPFDEFLTAEQRENALYADAGQFDGTQYAWPFIVGGGRGLFYNADVLEAAGVSEPPATWDEFVAAAEQIKEAGFTPFLQQWGDPGQGSLNATFMPFLWQAGGELFSADGTMTAFNSPEGLAAAEFVYGLKADGLMPDSVTGLNNEQALAQFAEGSVGFFMESESQLPPDLEVGHIDSLVEEQPAIYLAIDSLTITKNCEDPHLCADLVGYITSGPVMEQFHEFSSYRPVSADEEFTETSPYASLYADPSIVHADPIIPNSLRVYDILLENLQQMMLGQKTPEQALQDAADAGDAALAK